MFKKFFVMKIAVPAKNAVYVDDGNNEDAASYVEGNGEIIKVKEAPEDFVIDEYKVRRALNEYGFGQQEQDFICRALSRTGIV